MINPPDPDDPAPSPRAEEVAMTLSEERLELSTEWFVAGRIRLVKRVVTETRLVEVRVRREVLVVETDDVAAADGMLFGVATESNAVPVPSHHNEPIVLVLHEEVPVTTNAVRPYERIVATTSVIAGSTSVDDSVRREQYTVAHSRPGDAGISPARA